MAVRVPNKTISVAKGLADSARGGAHRVVYVPNGVTPPPEGRPSTRDARVTTSEYIVFLGRLVPEKGLHVLVEAYKQLDTKLGLVIVGGGTHTDQYEHDLKRLALGDPRIAFTGPLYGAEKVAVLRGAKLFVLPSSLEGMPIALLEAMICGVPCVVSDIPEHLDIIATGSRQLAYSFECGRPDSLANVLREALANGEYTKEMARLAKEYVQRTFSWDNVADTTAALYRECITRVS